MSCKFLFEQDFVDNIFNLLIWIGYVLKENSPIAKEAIFGCSVSVGDVGRLGNKMFELVAAVKVAKERNVSFCISKVRAFSSCVNVRIINIGCQSKTQAVAVWQHLKIIHRRGTSVNDRKMFFQILEKIPCSFIIILDG